MGERTVSLALAKTSGPTRRPTGVVSHAGVDRDHPRHHERMDLDMGGPGRLDARRAAREAMKTLFPFFFFLDCHKRDGALGERAAAGEKAEVRFCT